MIIHTCTDIDCEIIGNHYHLDNGQYYLVHDSVEEVEITNEEGFIEL